MNPDDIVLNFNPGTLVILNVVLGLIMFGIALDTTVDDFKVVARKPKPFVIAILAQLIVLPAVTFGLTLILPVTPSMALGMILVACCPPGNISQVLTHRSGMTDQAKSPGAPRALRIQSMASSAPYALAMSGKTASIFVFSVAALNGLTM